MRRQAGLSLIPKQGLLRKDYSANPVYLCQIQNQIELFIPV